MADVSPRSARLDHVRDTGELVFEAGGERFLVTVDDSLERAILEAKQIREESVPFQQPNAANALPISQIQQLIRAGADPVQVAEHYGLNEALVRRFSASVQTEKQYAIEQFKHVPAPKDSNVHTVEELIERTLQTARVKRETLMWGATRRGHEPWHISARFVAAGRKVHAEWSWNMHDNTVVCLNAAARKLFDEQPADTHAYEPKTVDVATEPFPTRTEPVGDAPTPEPTLPAARPQAVSEPLRQAGESRTPATVEQPAFEGTGADGTNTGNAPARTREAAANQAARRNSEAQPAQQPAGKGSPHTAKRRSGRSAVPSWDEILFGD